MNFAAQAAVGVVTRTGCLLSKDGRYLIQDQSTQEILEVRGNDLAAYVGNRVIMTGAASAVRPALSIATGVLNVTAIAQQEAGGCLSVASALGAQAEPTNASAAAQPTAAPAKTPPAATPKTGMSTGAKVAIVAVVAGGGAGAAIALAGGKKSTSP
jgi:hypothetical protein